MISLIGIVGVSTVSSTFNLQNLFFIPYCQNILVLVS